tara:strand:- start:5208 stop:6176 length:969 start_codon:yes stop_codon:yes gene_type:complete
MLGRGQCGAHITLIFTIEDSNLDPLEQGSRGAGLCLDDGVEAIAKGEEGGGSLAVRFLDGDHDSAMYEEVLKALTDEIGRAGEVDWELSIRMALPPSQGFGMSASGAIAAAISFQRAIGIPHEECLRRSFKIAHLVERIRSSGLGDTTALSSGGVERRLVAGSPYHGDLLDHGPGVSEGWSCGTPVLLCWRTETGTLTSGYIDEPGWKKAISEAGEGCMQGIGSGEWDVIRWGELLESSRLFAAESGLEKDASRSEIINNVNGAISEYGLSGKAEGLLCMLGESVVVVPKDPNSKGEWMDALSEALREAGLSSFPSRVGRLM